MITLAADAVEWKKSRMVNVTIHPALSPTLELARIRLRASDHARPHDGRVNDEIDVVDRKPIHMQLKLQSLERDRRKRHGILGMLPLTFEILSARGSDGAVYTGLPDCLCSAEVMSPCRLHARDLARLGIQFGGRAGMEVARGAPAHDMGIVQRSLAVCCPELDGWLSGNTNVNTGVDEGMGVFWLHGAPMSGKSILVHNLSDGSGVGLIAGIVDLEAVKTFGQFQELFPRWLMMLHIDLELHRVIAASVGGRISAFNAARLNSTLYEYDIHLSDSQMWQSVAIGAVLRSRGVKFVIAIDGLHHRIANPLGRDLYRCLALWAKRLYIKTRGKIRTIITDRDRPEHRLGADFDVSGISAGAVRMWSAEEVSKYIFDKLGLGTPRAESKVLTKRESDAIMKATGGYPVLVREMVSSSPNLHFGDQVRNGLRVAEDERLAGVGNALAIHIQASLRMREESTSGSRSRAELVVYKALLEYAGTDTWVSAQALSSRLSNAMRGQFPQACVHLERPQS